MKQYLVFDCQGNEREVIKARSHNAAEKKAKQMYGETATVCYTEF